MNWDAYERELKRYERDHNDGKMIEVWSAKQVAELLGQTPAAARAKMRNPLHPLGRVSYVWGGGKKPRWRVERAELLLALSREAALSADDWRPDRIKENAA